MCLRRAPEKYIAGAKAPVGAALDRAALDLTDITKWGLNLTTTDWIHYHKSPQPWHTTFKRLWDFTHDTGIYAPLQWTVVQQEL
jgi:hypothetical protein